MKKYLFCMTLLMAACSTMFAQDTPAERPTQQQVDRYIDAMLEMDYRQQTIDALELTKDQILDFDPIFAAYQDKKDELFQKKMELLDDYRKEMMEDDSEKNQAEDKADFIEDYWEVLIAEMDVRKEAFDKMENVLPLQKVAQYLMLEKAVEGRLSNNVFGSMMPEIALMERPSESWTAAERESVKDIMMAVREVEDKPEDLSKDDYRRYVNNTMELHFRNASYKALQLSEEEIEAFDPFFNHYMKKKELLYNKRRNLIKDIKEELAEDDSAKDEKDDKADFIENYWETEIAEMELKKETFDGLEDEVHVDKAIQFFLWEEAVENFLNQATIATILPRQIIVQKIPNRYATKPSLQHSNTASAQKDGQHKMDSHKNKDHSSVANADTDEDEDFNERSAKPTIAKASSLTSATKDKINGFNTWTINHKGQVDVSHSYTSDGLKALVGVFDEMKKDLNLNIADYDEKKNNILMVADKITEDWKDTRHADWTKAAFKDAAYLMNRFQSAMGGGMNSRLTAIANNLNGEKLMTKQADEVQEFFGIASDQLLKMNRLAMK